MARVKRASVQFGLVRLGFLWNAKANVSVSSFPSNSNKTSQDSLHGKEKRTVPLNFIVVQLVIIAIRFQLRARYYASLARETGATGDCGSMPLL